MITLQKQKRFKGECGGGNRCVILVQNLLNNGNVNFQFPPSSNLRY